MSETTRMQSVGEPDKQGQPEVGRLEERDERQHAQQQHGDTFAIDTDQPTDTRGVPTGQTVREQGHTEPSSPERQVTRDMADEQGSTPALVNEESDANARQRDPEEVARPGSTIQEQEAGKERGEHGHKSPEDTREGQQQSG